MPSSKAPTEEANPAESLDSPPVILDLGQKTRKKIAKLKKGEGPLYNDIRETVGVLQSEGIVAKDVQVIVAVVEKLPDGVVLPNMRWN